MVDVTVEFLGKTFKNPIVIASATPTHDAKRMKKAIDGGAAAVIAKSLFGNSGAIGRKFPRPRFKLYGWKDYPNYPKQVAKYFTLHSLEECSPFGYEDYVKDINEAKRLIGDKGIVICSISGSGIEEWEEMAEAVSGSKADLCEVNVSCPFAGGMGIKMGADAVGMAPDIVRAVKKKLAMPFSVKLSPQTTDLAPLALACEQAGAPALTIAARLSGIMIDINTGKPDGWGSIGGYGGPYLIGYDLKWVSSIAQKVKIPISAVMGVWDWEDVIRFLMVGATVVETCAAIMVRGYGIAGQWVNSMKKFMEKKGYYSIADLKGIALKHIKLTKDVERRPMNVSMKFNKKKCNGCGECVVSCFYDAITIGGDNKAEIDQAKCDVCGLCYEKCPVDAVEIVRK